jgi:hypothetical protein
LIFLPLPKIQQELSRIVRALDLIPLQIEEKNMITKYIVILNHSIPEELRPLIRRFQHFPTKLKVRGFIKGCKRSN